MLIEPSRYKDFYIPKAEVQKVKSRALYSL